MKLQRLLWLAFLVGTFAFVGCGDDDTGTGGAAGMGGGTGGVGGSIDPDLICSQGFCETDEVLREECVEFLTTDCIDVNPPVGHDECVALALSLCGAL